MTRSVESQMAPIWRGGDHVGTISGHVAAIDGLRAISVLAVLIYHINEVLLPGGFVGVDIFFVISGFVVTRSLISSSNSMSLISYVTRFYRRRVQRIMPALLLFLIVMSLISVFFIPDRGGQGQDDRFGLAAVFGVSNVLFWGAAEDYFSAGPLYIPYTHTWSLGVEEQFYVIFPVVLFMGFYTKKIKIIFGIICVFCLVSLFFCIIETSRNPAFAFYMLPTRFWELGVGALAALALAQPAYGRGGGKAWEFKPILASGLSILALVGLGMAFVLTDAVRFPFPWALLPVAAAVVLCTVVSIAPGTSVARALAWPPLVGIGLLSYSLYLWHFGIIVLLRWTVGMESLTAQVSAAVLSFGFAYASYRFVEQPFRKGAKLSQLPDRTILVGALASVFIAAAIMVGIFSARPWISFSVTRETALWSMDASATAEIDGCSVERRETKTRAGIRIEFVPIDCAPPAISGRQIAVIGDSHAGAYQILMQNVAGQERVPVTIYQALGCRVFRFWAASGEMGPACRRFVNDAISELAQDFGPEDVLFLPALRMVRFRETLATRVNETGPRTGIEPIPADIEDAEQAARDLAPLIDRGVRIVVEGPKPLFRSAPFRCADPFTVINPYCNPESGPALSVEREQIEARRLRAMKGIEHFVATHDGVSLWDPFLLLCPGTVCEAFRDGKPLFVDGDHLAPTGNLLLLRGFSKHLSSL